MMWRHRVIGERDVGTRATRQEGLGDASELQADAEHVWCRDGKVGQAEGSFHIMRWMAGDLKFMYNASFYT